MKTLIILIFLSFVGGLGMLVYNDAEAKRQQNVDQLVGEEHLQNSEKISLKVK
ncbi:MULTISPECIES: hypothetical protein [Acinetobacter]|uniref:hypothetical protein n=1 Tax=Acinetobacter TaxID=469 RepID=UPI00148C7DBD|nr:MULTISPECIES: hypothetical protein [Acinetobacter]MBI1453017.1 hypothetical protein [Acinetobacter sp. FL51]